MTTLDDLTYMVNILSKKREGQLYSASVTILRRQRNSFQTQILELQQELFPTESEAVDDAKSKVKAILNAKSPEAQIRFTVKPTA
jgi:hypothetical protein